MEPENLIFDENLSRFLKGEMTLTEEQEFTSLLAADSELRGKAVAVARLTKAMQEVGSADDNVIISEINSCTKEDIEKVITETTKSKRTFNRTFSLRKFLISLSAAASIIICVIGGYKYYKYRQVISLGKEYLAYFPATEFSRGEYDNIDDKLQEIYNNIASSTDLKSNIAELTRMWNASQSDVYNDYTEHMPQIGWILANALLRDNDKDRSIEVLDILIGYYSTDTSIGEKAYELKQKLEKL